MKMNEQIVEILLKAIPLKPVERDSTTENGAYEEWGKCPICSGTVAYISRGNSYCECCGQKIDWSVEPDENS